MSVFTARSTLAVGLTIIIGLHAHAAALPGGTPREHASLDADFGTHLPLLVVEFGPEFETWFDAGTGELRGAMRLIDNQSGDNRIFDVPGAHSRVAVRRIDLHARPGDKGKYAMNMESEAGQPFSRPLLDMPASDKWTLLGSGADKMGLRNYVAFALAGDMLPGNAPRARYCEVVFGDGRRHYYQGLYLLTEEIIDGMWLSPSGLGDKNYLARCDIVSPAADTAAGDAARFEAVVARARRRPLSGGILTLYYPDASQNPELTAMVLDELVKAENTVASDDSSVYFQYIGLLDTDAVIFSHLVNAVMANRGEELPVYFLKRGGRIGMSPLWDFDQSLDNAPVPLPGDDLMRGGYAWLDRLQLSAGFVDALRSRYFRLVRGPLRPSRVDDLLDRLYVSLGPAMKRDWHRWKDAYGEGDASRLLPLRRERGPELVRETQDPQQEFLKLKHALRLQGNALREYLMETRWQRYVFNYEMDARRNFLMASVFIAAFFALAHYARRRVR